MSINFREYILFRYIIKRVEVWDWVRIGGGGQDAAVFHFKPDSTL